MPYASGSDMIIRYDVRRLADLVSDTGIRPDPTSIAGNGIIAAMLDDASEMINSAVLVGKRYTRGELQSLGAGAPLLKRLTCDIAFYLLNARRGLTAQDTALLSPLYDNAIKMLGQLRAGERIFDFDDNADAGKAFYPNLLNSDTYVSKTTRYFGLL